MKPSETCTQFIAREEGCCLTAYQDAAGIWTIGYGTIMYEDGSRVKSGDKITSERAIELLRWQINLKSVSVQTFTNNLNLNQNQFDALVSFAYNCGIGALATSTLLKRIKINPLDPAIRDAFAMWNKITIGGKKITNNGLTARRKREADLYFQKI